MESLPHFQHSHEYILLMAQDIKQVVDKSESKYHEAQISPTAAGKERVVCKCNQMQSE